MGFKKNKKSKQYFGAYVGSQGGSISPEKYNLGLYSGLSFARSPFQVTVVSETPIVFGNLTEASFPTISFSLEVSINKGYIIDASQLGLTPGSPSFISQRENGDIVIVSNYARQVLSFGEYNDALVAPKIGGESMADTTISPGPLISLNFDYENGVNTNNAIPPAIWMEIKHSDVFETSPDEFCVISSVNIYSEQQLVDKYALETWEPMDGLEETDFGKTSYLMIFNGERFIFELGLGNGYLAAKSSLGQALPPGWEFQVPPGNEWSTLSIRDAYNLLYNPIIAIRGDEF